MTRPTLACPVRECDAALTDGGATLSCARGHAFDRARSGYVNLLNVHDRRAREPGDSKAAVSARRALLERGFGDALLATLAETVADLALAPGASVLDASAGEGTFLSALARQFRLTAFGVDISTFAVDVAARRTRDATWIVANSDRRLPFQDGGFDLVLSIDGRRNASEFARVMAVGAALIVAVPAEDDLIELRAAVLGAGTEIDRVQRVETELAAQFRLVDRRTSRATHRLERAQLEELATATYRCARRAERERLTAIDALDVTTSHHVLRFARR